MMEPVETRADDKMITALLDSLEVMKIKQYIQASPSNLKQYGLDKAPVTIICALENKSYPQQILIGNLSDDGRIRYVRDNREDWIYAVGATGLMNIPDTATDVRDKKVLRFKGYEVNMLEVVQGNYRLRVRRDMKEKVLWKLEEPFGGDADAVSVGKAFTALDSIYTEIFVSDDAGADMSRFGLDKPAMEITLLVGGRDNVPEEKLSLLVGKPFPGDENLVYIKQREGPTVSLVSNQFIVKLSRLISNTVPTS